MITLKLSVPTVIFNPAGIFILDGDTFTNKGPFDGLSKSKLEIFKSIFIKLSISEASTLESKALCNPAIFEIPKVSKVDLFCLMKLIISCNSSKLASLEVKRVFILSIYPFNTFP